MQLQQLEAEEEGEAEGVAEAAAEADCQPATLSHLCMSPLTYKTIPGGAQLYLHMLCMLSSLKFCLPKARVSPLLC